MNISIIRGVFVQIGPNQSTYKIIRFKCHPHFLELERMEIFYQISDCDKVKKISMQ